MYRRLLQTGRYAIFSKRDVNPSKLQHTMHNKNNNPTLSVVSFLARVDGAEARDIVRVAGFVVAEPASPSRVTGRYEGGNVLQEEHLGGLTGSEGQSTAQTSGKSGKRKQTNKRRRELMELQTKCAASRASPLTQLTERQTRMSKKKTWKLRDCAPTGLFVMRHPFSLLLNRTRAPGFWPGWLVDCIVPRTTTTKTTKVE